MEPPGIVSRDLWDLSHSVANMGQGLLASEWAARLTPAPQCRAGEEVLSNSTMDKEIQLVSDVCTNWLVNVASLLIFGTIWQWANFSPHLPFPPPNPWDCGVMQAQTQSTTDNPDLFQHFSSFLIGSVLGSCFVFRSQDYCFMSLTFFFLTSADSFWPLACTQVSCCFYL